MHPTTALAPHGPLASPAHPTRAKLTKIARWTLYVSGALAVLFGVIVWPVNVAAARGVHALTGWLVILSLWTLAGIAAHAKLPRRTVWLAVGWGLVTAFGAAAQYQLRPGSWITLLHVATGLGAIAMGQYLLTHMHRGELARATTAAAPAGSKLAIEDAAAEFLAKRRIAVTGVSREPAQHGSNVVYRRLREHGYQVFAINPHTTQVEGDRSYRDLKAVPGGIDAVVIATSAAHAMATMRECADLGIRHVWMHRSIGVGSVSEEAAAWGRAHGIRVISGGCPLMFEPVSDTGHKLMRSWFTFTGKVPRQV